MENKKGIIWARVSTQEQGKQYSLDAQLNELEEYAKQNNINIVKRFTSTSSGFKFDSPELQTLLDYMEDNQKEIDIILCTELDRIARDTNIGGFIRIQCRKLNINLLGINDKINSDNSEAQEFSDKVMMAAKELEVKLKNRRSIRGRNEKFKQGNHIGKAPYGYQSYISNGRKMVKPTGEGFKVKNIYEDYLKKDINGKKYMGYQKLAYKYEIFKKNTTNPMPLTVRNILHNPFYIGYICRFDKLTNKKVWKKGNHESIISEKLFFQINNNDEFYDKLNLNRGEI